MNTQPFNYDLYLQGGWEVIYIDTPIEDITKPDTKGRHSLLVNGEWDCSYPDRLTMRSILKDA